MNETWITITNNTGPFEHLARVLVKSAAAFSSRPIVVYGANYLPQIDGADCRMIEMKQEHLYVTKWRAVRDYFLDVSAFDLAVYVDADCVLSPTCDELFDQADLHALHPVFPRHACADWTAGLDPDSIEQATEITKALGVTRTPLAPTTPYLQCCYGQVTTGAILAIRDYLDKIASITLPGRPTGFCSDEPAWNAYLWAIGAKQHLAERVKSANDVSEAIGDRDPGPKREGLPPLVHGEKSVMNARNWLEFFKSHQRLAHILKEQG